ncbi:DUF292-domain-containing protein [Piromyces finnis]|uniref:DUF292-domain-containing protein n=1 Tax=Piromyces finnis TaxID=1754191 RepID=A0A1Y1VG33_9FUNG|nr:DUF292-domain-containing protein [Piromyces finnis]|eukprot:ORX54722.1 DUF292-domain-containing protein [Piromyces finnis]
MKFNKDKLKIQLNLVGPRMDIIHKKKVSLNIIAKNEIANLLEKGKINNARIKVETIIRDDFYIESLEILQLSLELLNSRYSLLNEKNVDDLALLSAIKTIIFAAPRCNIKEITKISEILQNRFGSKFTKLALKNADNDINEKIYHNFTLKCIDKNLIDHYLEEIATMYKVDCELTQKIQVLLYFIIIFK